MICGLICGWVGFFFFFFFFSLSCFLLFCFLPFVANIISFKTVQTWVETFQEIFTRLNELNIPGNKSRFLGGFFVVVSL